MKKILLALVLTVFLSGCSAVPAQPKVQEKTVALPLAPATPTVTAPTTPEGTWLVNYVDQDGKTIAGSPEDLPTGKFEQTVLRYKEGKFETVVTNLLALAKTKKKYPRAVTAQTVFESGVVTPNGLALIQDPKPRECPPFLACNGWWFLDKNKKDIFPLLNVSNLLAQSNPPIFADNEESAWGIVVPGVVDKQQECLVLGRVMNLVNFETDQVKQRIILAKGQTFSPRRCVLPAVKWVNGANIEYTIYDDTAPEPTDPTATKPILGTYTIDAF